MFFINPIPPLNTVCEVYTSFLIEIIFIVFYLLRIASIVGIISTYHIIYIVCHPIQTQKFVSYEDIALLTKVIISKRYYKYIYKDNLSLTLTFSYYIYKQQI